MTLRFKAAVFDMDGTLVDSMPTWRKVNRSIFSYFGCEIPEELNGNIESVSSRFVADYLNAHGITDMTRDDLILVYERFMRDHYLGEIEAKQGAAEYLASLAAEEIPMAVYTSTTASLAREALEKQGFLKYFDFVCDTHEIGYEKSKAEGYLLVAGRLNTPPEECVMHEDAPYAMYGARLAGYKVIAIKDFNNLTEPNYTQVREKSDVFIETFYDLL